MLAHIYGNLAYILNELGNYSSAKVYTDLSFQSISRLDKVDIDNLLWLINISSFYLDKVDSSEKLLVNVPYFYEFFIEYVESRKGSGSSDFQWAQLDALHVLYTLGSISDAKALDWSRSILSSMMRCSSGFDLGYAFFNRAYFAHQLGLVDESYISIRDALREYLSDVSFSGDWTAEALSL